MQNTYFERRKSDGIKLTATACLMLCAAGASGADGQATQWHFSGYGTLGVAHADTDQADFVSSSFKLHGAGRTRSWSPNVDSRLGAQLSVNFDPKWSAVLQVISEQDMAGSYRPRVEWANVKYQITPDLSVRVGRIALPMYLSADYRKVGYAYAYVRPPAEVYNRVPVTFSDGIDASYRWRGGAFKHQLQLSYGHNETRLREEYVLDVRNLTGLAYTVDSGALTMRASLLTAHVSSNIGADLFKGFRQFGPTGRAIADKYSIGGKRTGGVNFGAMYDPGAWYVTGELGWSNGRSLLLASRAAYVSAGVRRGDFTPYGILAYTSPDEATRIAGVPTAGLPRQASAVAATLNGVLNQYLGSIAKQSSVAVGVRWDVLPNAALKVQYEHLRPKGGTSGTLTNDLPGFRDGRTVNVSSAVLDFVF